MAARLSTELTIISAKVAATITVIVLGRKRLNMRKSKAPTKGSMSATKSNPVITV
jgi:hypothetical protein